MRFGSVGFPVQIRAPRPYETFRFFWFPIPIFLNKAAIFLIKISRQRGFSDNKKLVRRRELTHRRMTAIPATYIHHYFNSFSVSLISLPMNFSGISMAFFNSSYIFFSLLLKSGLPFTCSFVSSFGDLKAWYSAFSASLVSFFQLPLIFYNFLPSEE